MHASKSTVEDPGSPCDSSGIKRDYRMEDTAELERHGRTATGITPHVYFLKQMNVLPGEETESRDSGKSIRRTDKDDGSREQGPSIGCIAGSDTARKAWTGEAAESEAVYGEAGDLKLKHLLHRVITT
ncbi:hypothetical protein GUITHDRAFT_113887 [Guillardia theta CCMP2712]|uniref:Uncharacterized protein n=1 Tax=Guillardia theta (strain CCMP2712) TaxID=905079 RepID=L1IVI4_GUITC|nr:hypothetical protein GUITHDRAFT_113887 [Guillardia theta CCMP2712]EKX39894.1 hypothetical protein GUITHDRAFT_113887 [Guillardia theta CCMP2712]|eukprot:XP_005826874.1 hypothetical protein GUITHDRAFT_113887 [Guillardia theta CCMP2712]